MTRKGLGITAVVDEQNRLLGVFTDGDLRRALDRGVDVHKVPISDVMTRDCKSATGEVLAAEALKIMQDNKINALVVVDPDNVLTGVLNMHDLLRARVM
jgi:arabinose-5-phosphate isomerase